MSSVVSHELSVKPERSGEKTTNSRAYALAERLEQGARGLADFASTLTDAEWKTRIPKDGRKIGVVVHHVASVFPVEMRLALTVAKGQPVTGVRPTHSC